MNPEKLGAVCREMLRFTKEHAKYAGFSLLVACAPQPERQVIIQYITATPTPFEQPVTAPATSTPEPANTSKLEPIPIPALFKFLEFVPIHAVYLGDLVEQRDKEVKAGEILISRLHDERIFVKTTRFRAAPCAEGALRIVNLPMAEDPTQFRKRPGVTAKTTLEGDKFVVRQGASKLIFNNSPDMRSIEGELQFLIPASGQKLCPDSTFKAQFQVAGTQPLIETIATMNRKADTTPGIEYATQSLKAVSVIQGEELPIIPKQIDLIPLEKK